MNEANIHRLNCLIRSVRVGTESEIDDLKKVVCEITNTKACDDELDPIWDAVRDVLVLVIYHEILENGDAVTFEDIFSSVGDCHSFLEEACNSSDSRVRDVAETLLEAGNTKVEAVFGLARFVLSEYAEKGIYAWEWIAF